MTKKKVEGSRARTRAARSPKETATIPVAGGAAPDRSRAHGEELAELGKLRAHPRNYKKHTEAQLEHICASLREHGVYKNVVVAKDWTVLAGHGVVEAAGLIGLKQIPVRRLPLDANSPAALKILAGDNEMGRPELAPIDDRALASILRDVLDNTQTLEGTGFNAMDLATLETVLGLPRGENDPFREWLGMPECDNEDELVISRGMRVNFKSDDDKVAFGKAIGQEVTPKTRSIWWPAVSAEEFAHRAYVAPPEVEESESESDEENEP